MAQAKVSDYFGKKKRFHESQHPSKRRKLESTNLESKDFTETSVNSGANTDTTLLRCSEQRGKTPRSSKSTRNKTTTRARGSARKKHALIGQVTIQDAFTKATGSSSDTDQNVLCDTESSEVSEEPTSFWDEHDGPKTPKRKIRPSDSFEAPLSDCREKKSAQRRKPSRSSGKSAADCVTPKKNETDEDEKVSRGRTLALSFRRMLTETPKGGVESCERKVTKKENELEPSSSSSNQSKRDGCSSNFTENSPLLNTKRPEAMPSEEDWAQLLKPVHPVPISPLPPTPQEICDKVRKTSKSVLVSPRMKSSMNKLKELQKDDSTDEVDAEDAVPQKTDSKKSSVCSEQVVTPKQMRERLAKCGKLDSLKAKLAEMNSSLKAVRQREAEKKAEVDVLPEGNASAKAEDVMSATLAERKPAPAYERYEHLAREGPPSLALPGKYQHLLAMFQGTDTVVSMLFNRQEIITFSKLQTAVQSMTRKNFEQKALGQMKTVYPHAYNFRQEKGLPSFGQKVSGYQLTVEPILHSLGEEGQSGGKNEKPTMSAQVLLKRKRIFHNSLVNLTKDHHANFLSKLNPPIEVPTSKLTRWHPRFPLDSVPDVEVAELPAPPVQKVQTAKQVLESIKGKLPARVKEALAKVAVKSENSQPKPSTSGEQSKTAAESSASKPVSSPYRGIPLSLLEKIRAKEAARTQAALTRDPKEDRKTEMIGRLPTLIRSLRTFYVTEKKPSLPYKTVVEKLSDSYVTFISPAEVEAHLELLQELAPKWMQVISIARGKFIKIDKNMDISVIITELNNLAKSRR